MEVLEETVPLGDDYRAKLCTSLLPSMQGTYLETAKGATDDAERERCARDAARDALTGLLVGNAVRFGYTGSKS